MIKHGLSGSASYKSWTSMKSRCLNKKDQAYSNYGGRGIKVCSRWLKFENFFADMGERPVGKSLDRINNNKGYSPKNCRWATQEQQVNNKRSNIFIIYHGEKISLAQLTRIHDIKYGLAYERFRYGWSIERILGS